MQPLCCTRKLIGGNLNTFIFSYLALLSFFDIKCRHLPIIVILIFFFFSIPLYFLYNTNISFPYSLIPGLISIFISFISRKSLGYGDSIVILSLGIILNLNYVLTVIFIALFLSSFIGVIMFVIYKNPKKDLAFIPFLLISFIITIL